MLQIGTPLDKEAFVLLPESQQDVLRAFFIEADTALENEESLKKDAVCSRFIPPQSLQDKYTAIVGFGGDEFCPVRQRVKKFAFFTLEKTDSVIN